ncbi:MAG: hypothetical protein AAGM38_12965 [Pseudomonadota bacterium]
MHDAFHCDITEAAAFATSLAGASCPGCGDDRLTIVYGQAAQPSLGAALFSDARAAVKAPWSEIDLAFCQGCGATHNLHFEPSQEAANTIEVAPNGRIRLDRLKNAPRFLAALKRQVETSGKRAALRFEAQDASDVFEAGAFEQIQADRCTYFTPGALARTLRAAGLEVTALEATAEGLLHATATPKRSARAAATFPIEEPVEETKTLVSAFAQRAAARAAAWRAELLAASAGPVALWGADARSVAFASAANLKRVRPHVVDADASRQAAYLAGFETPILAPSALAELAPALVVAMDKADAAAARAALKAARVKTKLLTLDAH